MEPSPFSDGNLPASGGARSGLGGFNGAIAFQRWKRDGPTARALRGGSFNGAIAFQRWKRVRDLAHVAGGAVLQWSHRLSAMETLPIVLSECSF